MRLGKTRRAAGSDMLLPMSKTKLLVISPPDHSALHNLEKLRDDADIYVSNSEAELETLAGPAEVILISSAAAKSINLVELWKRAKSVRWVHSLSAGVDGILFPEFVESDVPLSNARGIYKRPLAEFAVLGLLFHFKKLRRLIDNQRERR